jgi:hypothetical protein
MAAPAHLAPLRKRFALCSNAGAAIVAAMALLQRNSP